MRATSTALAAALLGLTLPAQAQASRPDKKTKLAGEWIAEALVAARKNKQLARILTKRTFFSKGLQPVLVTTAGTVLAKGIEVQVAWEYLREGETVALSYRFGVNGLLEEVASRTRNIGWRMVIAGAEIRTTRIAGGRVGRQDVRSFSHRVVPFSFAMFLLPSLHDQGLPKEVRCGLSRARWLASGRPLSCVIRRTTKPAQSKLGQVHTVTFTRDSSETLAEAFVAADGKQKGQLLRLSMPGKRVAFDFRLLSAAQAARLERDKRVLGNEARAIEGLRTIARGQDTFRSRGGSTRYAGSLEELAKAKVYLPTALADGSDRGYLFMIRRSPDAPEARWMALAVPQRPGKTGKRYFVVNHDGKVHASDKKLELNDTCAIPKGAKKLR